MTNEADELDINDLKIYDRSLYVSLTSNKLLHFNKALSEKNFRNKESVVLFYSKLRNAIVFEFLENHTEDSIRIYRYPGGKLSISCGDFFRYFKINSKQYIGRHMIQVENIKGIGERWILFLQEPHPIRKRKLNNMEQSEI